MRDFLQISLRVVPHGGPEFHQMVELRRKVLRAPLGLDFDHEELAAEHEMIHLGAFDEPAVVGCLVLVPLAPDTFKMRQVAVSPDHQRMGIGQRLVEKSEQIALEQGADQIVLHARETAVAFYVSMGYKVMGEPFEEVGIPHREMRKRLND